MRASDRTTAALKEIRSQFRDTPEHKLCFAVIEQAVKDLACTGKEEDYAESARYFLSGEMPYAGWAGVDPGWIRRVLKKFQIYG